MTHYNHFQRGTGKYTCRRCKQATRDTGTGEAQHDLCKACYEIESYENEHSDDNHSGTIHDCKKCRKYMTPATIAKLDEENAAIKKAIPTTKLSRKQKSQAKAWEKVAQRPEPEHMSARTSVTLLAYSQAIDKAVEAANILREIIEHDAANAERAKRDLAAIQKASSQIERSANAIFNKTPEGKQAASQE